MINKTIFTLALITISMLLISCKLSNESKNLSFTLNDSSIYKFSTSEFISKFCTETGSNPEDLFLASAGSESIRLTFEPNGLINDLYFECCSNKKENESTMTSFYQVSKLNNNFISSSSSDAPGNVTKINITKLPNNVNGNNYLIPLKNFLSVIQKANWKEITSSIIKSDLFGFSIDGKESFFNIGKYKNVDKSKYIVDSSGTRKLEINDEIEINGIAVEVQIKCLNKDESGYNGRSSDTSVILELKD